MGTLASANVVALDEVPVEVEPGLVVEVWFEPVDVVLVALVVGLLVEVPLPLLPVALDEVPCTDASTSCWVSGLVLAESAPASSLLRVLSASTPLVQPTSKPKARADRRRKCALLVNPVRLAVRDVVREKNFWDIAQAQYHAAIPPAVGKSSRAGLCSYLRAEREPGDAETDAILTKGCNQRQQIRKDVNRRALGAVRADPA